MRYINYNGNIYSEHEALLPVTNRAYRYGDGFFESMVMFNKKIPLLEYHFSRIQFTAEVLSGTLPQTITEDLIESMVLDLASVNDGVRNARVRIQFYRKGTGLYLPNEDEFGFSITMEALENTQFECGNGLVVGMRDDCYKSVSMVSDLKNSSALTYVVAAQFAKAEGWDELLLLNHYSNICEALHSNIFIVKGDKLITPDLDSGCVNGVMRSYILSVYEGEIEERPVTTQEVLDADEVLLTNAVRGIQWVSQFQASTYKNKRAVDLTALLNKNLLGTISS
jgi:branched-chain amino acid aminotransferase